MLFYQSVSILTAEATAETEGAGEIGGDCCCCCERGDDAGVWIFVDLVDKFRGCASSSSSSCCVAAVSGGKRVVAKPRGAVLAVKHRCRCEYGDGCSRWCVGLCTGEQDDVDGVTTGGREDPMTRRPAAAAATLGEGAFA